MTGRSAFRLIVIIALALTFAAFPYPKTFPSLGVVPGAAGCLGPCCTGGCLGPSNRWVPSGPSSDKLRIQVYSDEIAEYNALQTSPSQFDLPDSPIPKSLIAALSADTRFFVTAPSPDFGMFDIDFNHANNFFGVFNDQHGNNPQGIEFREGVAHLIDKPAFISSIIGLGSALDNPLPPGQGVLHSGQPFNPQSPPTLGCTVSTTTVCATGTATGPYNVTYRTGSGATGTYDLGGVCGWDTIQRSCTSAFRLQAGSSDSNGMALVGSADFCLAADHFIAAGLATGKNATTCVLTGWRGTSSINFVIRSDNAPRFALGAALKSRVCDLIGLGQTACPFSPVLLAILQVIPDVFSTSSTLLSWHMYTAGWSLSAQFDQLFAFYNSRFASTECGGKQASFGEDYIYFCNSDFDRATSMLEFNDTLSGAVASANLAMDIFGKHLATIPIWSGDSQFAYLNSWTGVSDAAVVGPPNFFSLLNMWSPNPPVLDGNGNSVIRWGFSSGTTNLNPFLATSPQELRVVRSIYDTLFVANPYSPLDVFGWMADQFQILPPQPGDPVGTLQDIQISLRPDMFWHDGLRLTAQDVKFSLLGAQQLGNGVAAPYLSPVLDVTILSDLLFRINLVQVSPFLLLNGGSEPIVPQHIWASDTTTSCTIRFSPQCTVNPALLSGSAADPVVNHRLIGSGPWMCIDLATGAIGGGCVTPSGGTPGSGTQAIGLGGTMLLQRNAPSSLANGSPTPSGGGLDQTAYFRTSAKYLQWQWADIFGHGTVDLIDFASAKACTNKAVSVAGCAHWDTPAYGMTFSPAAGSTTPSSKVISGGNSDGVVNTSEVAQVASWVGVSWTSPLAYGINHSTGATTIPTGAQTVPQTIYEGGVTYVAETTP